MAFTVATAPTPVAIADIELRLFSPDPAGEEQPSAQFSLQVRYSDNSLQVVSGNLQPHLTQAQVNGLLNFMADLRGQANAQILP